MSETLEQPQSGQQVDPSLVHSKYDKDEQAKQLLEDQGKKLESFPSLTADRVKEIILALYGDGEPIEGTKLPYYKGDIETAESHIIDAGPRAYTVLVKLGQESNYLFSLIKENIKGRVIVEIGPSNAWIRSALYAKKNGASAYVGIDIDEHSITFPNLSDLEYQTGKPVSLDDLQGFIYPICDDPANFLAQLEDHSVVTISSAVFSEPMDKNYDYRKKLQDLLNEKTLFGLHRDAPDFDPSLFIQCKDRDEKRVEVVMYKNNS